MNLKIIIKKRKEKGHVDRKKKRETWHTCHVVEGGSKLKWNEMWSDTINSHHSNFYSSLYFQCHHMVGLMAHKTKSQYKRKQKRN